MPDFNSTLLLIPTVGCRSQVRRNDAGLFEPVQALQSEEKKERTKKWSCLELAMVRPTPYKNHHFREGR